MTTMTASGAMTGGLTQPLMYSAIATMICCCLAMMMMTMTMTTK